MRKTDGIQGRSMPPHRVTDHHGAMLTANSLIRSTAEAVVKREAGLTMTQYFILVRLLGCREPETMSSLAQKLLLNTSTLSTAFALLENEGLAVRIPHEQDQRIVRAGILRRGAAAVEMLDEALWRLFQEYISLLDDHLLASMMRRNSDVMAYYDLTRTTEGRERHDTAFFEVAHLVYAQIEAACRECNFTVGEYRVLDHLARAMEGSRVSAIAQELCLRTADVTTISKRLVARGLIGRTPDPADRRATLLEVTTDGYAAITEASPVMAGHIRHTHQSTIDMEDIHGEIARRFVEHFSNSSLL